MVSKLIRVHPARFAHCYLAAGVVVLCYIAVFAAFSEAFATSNKNNESTNAYAPWAAVLIFATAVLFGGGSIRSYGSMVLLRPWQGKAIFCGIMLPLFLSRLISSGEYLLKDKSTNTDESVVGSWINYFAQFIVLYK